MTESIPRETGISKNLELRKKFEDFYRKYEQGVEGYQTLDQLAIMMKVSPRTIDDTVKRLKYETTIGTIQEEVKEEAKKKFTHFAMRDKTQPSKAIFTSPIPQVQDWIDRILSERRPLVRAGYIRYCADAWKYISDKYGLYNPLTWTKVELEDYVFSAGVRKLKKSTQNRLRTAINSLMKSLGKRDIFFPKLGEEKKEAVYMTPEVKRHFFEGCLKEFPENGVIPFTVGVIALKTATRIGSIGDRDVKKPENDRGILCIRMDAIDLSKSPIEMHLRDKGKGELGQTWTKLLDEEGEKYLREYLAWREQARPEWKDNVFLFGTTSYEQARLWMAHLRRRYNLYVTDRWGVKRPVIWHMFRDTFANECLLAQAGGEEADMDRGVLACCQLGGWTDPKTFVNSYVATETINKLKKLWFAKIKDKINTGL